MPYIFFILSLIIIMVCTEVTPVVRTHIGHYGNDNGNVTQGNACFIPVLELPLLQGKYTVKAIFLTT